MMSNEMKKQASMVRRLYRRFVKHTNNGSLNYFVDSMNRVYGISVLNVLYIISKEY